MKLFKLSLAGAEVRWLRLLPREQLDVGSNPGDPRLFSVFRERAPLTV